MAIIPARSWDRAEGHGPSEKHRGRDRERQGVSHAMRGIAYAADRGWARRAAPGVAGSSPEAPWLCWDAAGSDGSRLMSAARGRSGSDTGVVVWKPGGWGGRRHSTAVGGSRGHRAVNTRRHHYVQNKMRATRARWSWPRAWGVPGACQGDGQGGGPVPGRHRPKVAEGDGEEQSSTPFQGDSVGR